MSSALDDALRDVMTFGSLAPLAAFTDDAELAERLRTATTGEPTATDIAIQARLTFKILKDEGWDATAIIETILTRHYDGSKTRRPKIETIVHNSAGRKVNKPADALFAELQSSPARFDAARAALGLPSKYSR